jgi:hypothetical protein
MLLVPLELTPGLGVGVGSSLKGAKGDGIRIYSSSSWESPWWTAAGQIPTFSELSWAVALLILGTSTYFVLLGAVAAVRLIC